jgi:hypothetical protein
MAKKTTKRKRPPTRLDKFLADPAIVAASTAIQEAKRAQDIRILTALASRLNARYPRRSHTPTSKRLAKNHRIKIYRDPLDVIARYLRRKTQGPWHRGGSHIARLHHGPGIGIQQFRNDRRTKIQAIVLNA